MLSLPAPAKLNLFLHITGRRDNGYHELQTCFQLLDYGDQLEFERVDSPAINLESNLNSVAAEDNLIIKAAVLLQQHAQVQSGATIKLTKKLPLGAGLGGGSSDAATTLLALNKLWNCGLTTDELVELGLTLGADVPVFIRGHSAWAEGVGEKLTAMALPEPWYVVISPNCQVSTEQIFCHEQLTRNSSTITIPAFPFQGVFSENRNDCEAVAIKLYPEIGAALNWLNNYAPARMTGTGSSIFASFDTRAAAEQVLADLPGELKGFIAQGINKSPVLQALRFN
ncbi:MAG: 4-(cytidine 5'-diphospho)-2-C-methyl-D-erythritol kinase [SAR86 cluster bacterium]|uniref:4-diphosphocytidyl-2-C-methyl-D-erythritol kinase n=1 Tax=SAR86 cluster bacterium TaxID=2030880 RepID=A0A2A5CGN7_9GAMM|nr:4-(cytidine 5'-diphospho)-2-C-methyl-D-erythritol kinase [Gammaproteobacteria bacterium AH-315-E17]PCJ42630.1 MAG: 4-(cytidine 5'-diphospho)-2-C-methyl-D-erythritol kinase [SAR86 cluster bacterium]